MSVSGLSSSNFFQSLGSSSLESNFQTFKKEFQQRGQDLQSGNLSQAQADFAALQPPTQPVSSSSQSSSTSNSLRSTFQQLTSDLQSGNLTAAQQDYSTIQQDFQQQASSTQAHHHHHHHHSDSSQASGAQNPLSSLFSQLGQALQSGNLFAAQSAYSSLQQEFQQLSSGASSSTPSSTSASSSSSVNVTA